MGRKKKCLILFNDVGGGFKSVSVTVKKELEERGYEVFLLDLFKDLDTHHHDRITKKLWGISIKTPYIYKLAFFMADVPSLLNVWTNLMPQIKSRLLHLIKREKYDMVFSTSPLTTQLIGNLRSGHNLGVPLFAYNAEAMRADYCWVNNDIDGYFVPTQNAFEEMIKHGMDEKKLRLIGFPIDKKFLKLDSKAVLRSKLDLSEKFTVLLMAGGDGSDKLYDYVESLLGLDVQVIAICGKNASLYERLKKLSATNPRLKAYGYVHNMQEFLQCSDVVAGRAGFNFVFECIYLQKPMIINSFLRNEVVAAKYVLANNLGWVVKNTEEFSSLVKKIIGGRSVLLSVQNNMKRFKYESGAKEMADHMIRFSNFKEGVKVLLFDLGGTLCRLDIEDRWSETNIEGIMAVLKRIGAGRHSKSALSLAEEFVNEKARLREEAKHSLEEFPLKVQLERFLGSIEGHKFDDGEKSLDDLESIYIRPELGLAEPLPHVSEVLERLSKRYRLALVSNNVSEMLVKGILRKCGIERFFSDVFVSSRIGFRKPHRNFMSHVLKELKARPSECVIIGDRLNQDILMAKKSSIKSVNVTMDAHEDNRGIEGIQADYTVQNLRDLLGLL